MPLRVSSTRAHRQEAKIVLYNLWYHHTYRWPSRAQVQRGLVNIKINILRCAVRAGEVFNAVCASSLKG